MTAEQRFRAGVFARDSWRCLFHDEGDCDGRLQAHHLIPRQTLKALARRGIIEPAKLDEAIADARNGIIVCESDHALKVPRLKRDDLPERVESFADDWGVAAELDSFYGASTDPDRPVATPAPRVFGALRQRGEPA